jgi:hypothetical protein
MILDRVFLKAVQEVTLPMRFFDIPPLLDE